MGKGGKKQAKNKSEQDGSCTAGPRPSDQEPSLEKILSGLPEIERNFLTERVTVTLPLKTCSMNKGSKSEQAKAKKEESETLERIVSILERFNMVILHNALSPDEMATIREEYEAVLDFSQAAIGDKDASKRSGTRLYNCSCQLGPGCGFEGWKAGAHASRNILHDHSRVGPSSMWEKVVDRLGFPHIARVEMVTSHKGCRHQDWHVDGAHGITVIFPLVSTSLERGPTQLEFTTPFNSLAGDRGKVKKRDPIAPECCHAAMPAGSVLLFNANCSHRGTANLSTGDRPILVLDTSPPCEALPHSLQVESLWDL